ncbi:Fur family transcriptional regulator [Hirschia baltica]|uniref:Ferric uptake regulation protein n=1 Tax=Hirschia baltica (strain ATCC 49814 / DSM 5838 / IFAM 1418) TaxID=582402 RepID=C6XLW9_HIRBI|nr:Fur family transcriptional regulator [Hirschia baltica]ACT59801.1 ferric uptake regulator, Fur family [Hirschia baltica ATCC 49814]
MTQEKLSRLFEENGMRLTRPRLAVAELLLMDGVQRHVSAEWVAKELVSSNNSVSLASVYNTLNSFVEIGLLRQIDAGGASVVFDTNTSEHHHFLKVSTGELIDIESNDLEISNLPTPPEGSEIKGWSLIVHID